MYEYECEACGHRFELIQKFSDPLVEVCPNCAARKVHKLLSSPAIQFKGSGFYITDYARKGSSDSSSDSEPPKAEPTAKKADDSTPSSTSTAASSTTASSSSTTDTASAAASPSKNS